MYRMHPLFAETALRVIHLAHTWHKILLLLQTKLNSDHGRAGGQAGCSLSAAIET